MAICDGKVAKVAKVANFFGMSPGSHGRDKGGFRPMTLYKYVQISWFARRLENSSEGVVAVRTATEGDRYETPLWRPGPAYPALVPTVL
jgi:hypothetical protein